MPVGEAREDSSGAIIRVRDVAALLVIGAWLLVTVSACEHSKRAHGTGVEERRAQMQQAAEPDAMAEQEIAQTREPEVARLAPFDFIPERPPQPRLPEEPVAAVALPAAPAPPAEEAGLADVFFDFDRYAIRSDAVPVLERNAELLKQAGHNAGVLLEGHCDELGSVQYNLELGKRRAQAVKDYLVDLGVEASGIHIVSYGKERPFCAESTRRCRQRNRRVHFVR